MWSFLNRNALDKREIEPLVNNKSTKEDVIIVMENNHINSLPAELIKIILSFLSIRELANLSMVNKPFYQGVNQFIPMKEKMNVPFFMFTNNSGTQTPATYLEIRPIIAKNFPLEKQLNVLENDVVRKSFDKNSCLSASVTFCLCIFLGGIGAVIAEGVLFHFKQTKDENQALQMLSPLIACLALGLTLGCFCYRRHSKMDNEEGQIRSEITPLPSLN